MGTWGVGILENDNSSDVHGEYHSLFEAGKSAAAILRQLKEEHLDPDDARDRAEFWPAISLAQWECGELAPATLAAVKRVIQRDDGLDEWQAESAANAKARRKALAALLKKISTANPSPKSRGARARPRSPFKPGTCIAFRFPDGSWGAAVAMKARPGWGGSCFLKVLNYRAADLPEPDVFERRKWLHDRLPNGKRSDDPFVMPLLSSVVEANPHEYVAVGMLKLTPADDYNYYTMSQGDVGTIVAYLF